MTNMNPFTWSVTWWGSGGDEADTAELRSINSLWRAPVEAPLVVIHGDFTRLGWDFMDIAPGLAWYIIELNGSCEQP